MIALDLKQGDLFRFPTGIYEFQKEWPGNKLHFVRVSTKLDLPLPEDMLEQMLDSGKATRIAAIGAAKADDQLDKDRDLPLQEADLEVMLGEGKATRVDAFDIPKLDNYGRPQKEAALPAGEFGPDDEGKPDILRARTLQYYVRKFDEIGGSKGDLGLQRFIDEWRPHATQAVGERYNIGPATLRRAIGRCGEPGKRPLRVFRSMRGKGRRRRLDPFIHESLDRAVIFYWSDRRRTYQAAWDYFGTLVYAENDRREAAHATKLPLPTRQEILRRRINAAECHAMWAMKYSKREANFRFNGIKDGLKADHPLEVVIMDHTVLDTWLVLDTSLYLPLGRPTLTVAIDVCTRMVLGYLISFEPASLYSVLTTLKRVNRPKHYVQTHYPEISRKWDAWGRPETLVVDQGREFKSPSLQDALADTGTEILWAPVRTPQYKAIGERFFGTLNSMLAHRLIGGVPYDPRKMNKLGLDPAKDATITLGDLDALMHRALDVYHHDKHEGLGAIPARIWRDKIRAGRRHFINDIAALDSMLGRVDTAVLTRKGILFKNMQFHEDTVTGRLLDELVAYERKRAQSDQPLASGQASVKIKYLPNDASSISVWNRAGTPPHYVTLRNRNEIYARGLSFWHHDRIREYAEAEDLAFVTEREMCEARDSLREDWERLAGLNLRMRETRDARRGLAFSQTFDETKPPAGEDARPDEPLTGPVASDFAKATMAPEDVEDVVVAGERKDDGEPAAGRAPSKTSIRKAKATRERHKREAAEDAKQARRDHEKRMKAEASGVKPKPDLGKAAGAAAADLLNKIRNKAGWGQKK